MIDTTQLTQLISAFRVETEKESISPETVGSLLQNITDLLANASCGVFLMLSRHHAIHYLCTHARSLTYCHPLYNCSSALRLNVIVTSKRIIKIDNLRSIHSNLREKSPCAAKIKF